MVVLGVFDNSGGCDFGDWILLVCRSGPDDQANSCQAFI